MTYFYINDFYVKKKKKKKNKRAFRYSEGQKKIKRINNDEKTP